MMRRKRIGVAAALVCGLVGGSAATAVAGEPVVTDLGSAKGLSYASFARADAVTAPNSTRFSATCPQDPAVVGGGLYISGSGGEATMNRIESTDDQSDANDKPDDRWEVEGSNLAGSAKTFTGYLICRNAGPRGLRYVSDFDPLETGRLSVTVRCPNGTEVVGGGAVATALSSSNSGFVKTSRPFDGGDRGRRPDDGWRADLYNGSLGTGVGRVTAICLRNDRWRVSYRRDVFKDLVSGGGGGTLASCPNGTSVAGGGAAVGPGEGEAWLNSSSPVDGGDEDGVPDDGWTSYYYNFSGDPKDITAFAVCKG